LLEPIKNTFCFSRKQNSKGPKTIEFLPAEKQKAFPAKVESTRIDIGSDPN